MVNIKTKNKLLQKATLWSEELFMIKKVKNILLVVLTENKLFERFTKMNWKNKSKRV